MQEVLQKYLLDIILIWFLGEKSNQQINQENDTQNQNITTQPSTKLEGIEVPLKLNSEQFDSKNLLLQNEVFQMSKQIEGTLYILIKFPIFRKHRRRRNFS